MKIIDESIENEKEQFKLKKIKLLEKLETYKEISAKLEVNLLMNHRMITEVFDFVDLYSTYLLIYCFLKI